MCIELMLNSANLNFVAGAMYYGDVNGWVFTAIAIAIAAAEVAIGLANFAINVQHPINNLVRGC